MLVTSRLSLAAPEDPLALKKLGTCVSAFCQHLEFYLDKIP